MNLVYICKNSWWDGRKARKVLLPLALSELDGVRVLLVNAAVPLWLRRQKPKLWLHPRTGMKVLTPFRMLPLQRFRFIRKFNQMVRWQFILQHIRQFQNKEVADFHFVLSDPEDIYLADYIKKAGYPCYFDWTENWSDYARSVGDVSQSRAVSHQIVSYVDGVIVVSDELEEETKKLGLKYLHLQNAVSEYFIQSLDRCKKQADPLAGIPSPRVIHVGSYNSAWIHWDWLISMALQNPSVSFCMIGGGGENDLPINMPQNIFLLGRVKYEDIPAYLCHSQVCMLLYKDITTSAGDPTKIYEYLATGLPIISSPHPRCIDFEEYVYLAEDAEELHHQLQRALHEGDSMSSKRIQESRKHTWSIRAKALRTWLEQ